MVLRMLHAASPGQPSNAIKAKDFQDLVVNNENTDPEEQDQSSSLSPFQPRPLTLRRAHARADAPCACPDIIPDDPCCTPYKGGDPSGGRGGKENEPLARPFSDGGLNRLGSSASGTVHLCPALFKDADHSRDVDHFRGQIAAQAKAEPCKPAES